jgi:hypothetical protein
MIFPTWLRSWTISSILAWYFKIVASALVSCTLFSLQTITPTTNNHQHQYQHQYQHMSLTHLAMSSSSAICRASTSSLVRICSFSSSLHHTTPHRTASISDTQYQQSRKHLCPMALLSSVSECMSEAISLILARSSSTSAFMWLCTVAAASARLRSLSMSTARWNSCGRNNTDKMIFMKDNGD